MNPVVQPDLLDLRHFSSGALRPLLEEEATQWNERLRWDYRASAKTLLEYLDSRILPGYVAMEGQRVTGFAFCVYEQNKAVIGDVFATSSGSEPAIEIESRLIEHLLELLQHSPGVDRIETQLLLHAHGRFTALFARNGCAIYERLFMERPLGPEEDGACVGQAPAPSLPSGLELRAWRETDFAAAGRLISLAYRGHLDSAINDQYRTVAGSLRFLHNIVRFPGCGFFDPASSLVVAQGADQLAALLLCSRVSEDAGHVTQICVAPELRGCGIGRMLLSQCCAGLKERGLHLVTLTVTQENSGALALYESCGFRARHTFDAVVWDRNGAGANDG